MNKWGQRKISSHLQPGGGGRSHPCTLGEEVKEPWTEGQKVGPIARMLDEGYLTAVAQHARQLAKQLYTGLMAPKLVSDEHEEDRIQPVIRKRQGPPIGRNRRR